MANSLIQFRTEEALRIKQAEGTEAAIAYLEKETDYRKIAADNEAKTLQDWQNVRAREYAEAQKAYQIALDNYRASGAESDKKRLTEAYAFVKESRRAYEEAGQQVGEGEKSGINSAFLFFYKFQKRATIT